MFFQNIDLIKLLKILFPSFEKRPVLKKNIDERTNGGWRYFNDKSFAKTHSILSLNYEDNFEINHDENESLNVEWTMNKVF